jgi:LPXTG-motif cell wall-anchored protein
LALNSTSRRRFGVGLGVVLTGAVAGLIGFAGVASAHVPVISAECAGKTTTLTVTLSKYDGSKTNTVKITDGDTVLEDTQFKDSYSSKKSANADKFAVASDVKHTFTVVVKAGDDPSGKKGFSFTEQKVVEACVTPPSTETTTTTTEVPPPPTSATTTSPVAAPVVATSTTTPAAQAAPPLAATGASIAIPLGIGGVLLVGGAALLFVVRRRSKA